jgi:hypothetical protein
MDENPLGAYPSVIFKATEISYIRTLDNSNKAPRRKQRGINFALQSAGLQPAFAPRGGELNP